MKEEEIICILCPLGCTMTVSCQDGDLIEVTGNGCQNGSNHAKQEVSFPGRVLTTTIRTSDQRAPLIPVRSNHLVPKEHLVDCMVEIAKHVAEGPVKTGEPLIKNILGLHVDIIACREHS